METRGFDTLIQPNIKIIKEGRNQDTLLQSYYKFDQWKKDTGYTASNMILRWSRIGTWWIATILISRWPRKVGCGIQYYIYNIKISKDVILLDSLLQEMCMTRILRYWNALHILKLVLFPRISAYIEKKGQKISTNSTNQQKWLVNWHFYSNLMLMYKLNLDEYWS